MSKKTFVGIDVSSKKLNIHILGARVADFEIENTQASVSDFIKKSRLTPKEYVIGVESTGKYHLACQREFVKRGFEFRVLNPILTGKKIASSIRKKKTDKSDAVIIAKLIDQGEGSVVGKDSLDKSRRSILRTRKTLVDHRSAVKRLLFSLGKEEQNTEVKKSQRKLTKLIKQMDECVESFESVSLDEKYERDDEELIRSIPGFATQLSAIVSEEVGDFSRFPSATQFKAFVGIDPKVTQSGNMLMTGKITKRGNPHLRSAFYLAAQVARQHDPELKAFYQKKKDEGKPTRVAIVAVARKLCERVYSVVTKGRPYEIREVES
jgi:transposase